ncbi:hypothetical protein [Bradyrhizobium sp. SZCCHNRI20481]|uniref:hypothetical protein n=1 Tax=Bradyrhizobium sp. SZCCHNRI20481 TaxID=3057286 RepID=UPI002916041C|nr:hypothetical protein [Bradyrhizobium sp. SZCCHNRI20481]
MTSDERSSIDNAIWLCADHAALIDRDEVSYPIETLRTMKVRHEAACAKALRTGANPDLGADLLAVGPDVVFAGDVTDISAASWTLRLRHFVVGDINALISFVDEFGQAAPQDKYVLSNAIGDGRVLSNAPRLSKHDDGYSLLCPVAPGFPRVDVQRLGSGLALHPETHDLYLDSKGSIARLSGLDYFPQKVQSVLSMQRDENVFAPSAGMRFFEYYQTFKGTPWLALMMKLDLVRQAAIPRDDSSMGVKRTPLHCVTRVRGVELLAEEPTSNRLSVRVDFDVQGLGQWQREMFIYLPTREQMDARARLVEEMKHLR